MCVVGRLMGQRVAVIVNHWPSRIGGQEKSSPNREAAARLCRAISDSLWRVDPQIGVIIMGDLNDDPMDKSCSEVLGAKRDKKDVTEDHAFFSPFWSILDHGTGTLAYKSLKDTEGARQNYPLRTFASGVYLNGYSDHFPTEIFVTRRIPAPKR